MNLLQILCQHGQSVWLDGLERNLILTGQLQRSIDDGLRGVLSNFTSLEQAIAAGSYDRDFWFMERQADTDARSLYTYLTLQDMQLAADRMKALQDMQLAADRMKAVHTQTRLSDGFVNLDLPPEVVLDPPAMLIEARRLWQTVGWSNFMLEIPASAAAVSVIEQLIQEGINVNVTMLCSQAAYEQVTEAYLRGLETLALQGKEVSTVASVISVPIGRLDDAIGTLIDSPESRIEALPEMFRGKVAIAQAKMLYQRYQTVHQSDRWQALARLGAQPQRLLWDITSLKNDRFQIQHYIESLMGTDTILKVSPLILQDQYNPSRTHLTVEVEIARQTLEDLEQIISLETIADRLLAEELQRSQQTYKQLLSTIEQRRQKQPC